MCGERRREPLALALALLGRNFRSVWLVLLPFLWANVITCCLQVVTPDLSGWCQVGPEEGGSAPECTAYHGRGVASLSISVEQPLIICYSGQRLNAEGCPVAPHPWSPTDDLRPPTPTVVAEVTRDERRRKPLGTCARAAGSFVSVASSAVSLGATVITRRLQAVNPDLSPGRSLSRARGRRGRAGVSSLSHHFPPRGNASVVEGQSR